MWVLVWCRRVWVRWRGGACFEVCEAMAEGEMCAAMAEGEVLRLLCSAML